MSTPAIDDGGPAFPVVENISAEAWGGSSGNPHYPVTSTSGMSLRAWLAGLTMQGLCANKNYVYHSPKDTAAMAVRYSDALIEELNKPEERQL